MANGQSFQERWLGGNTVATLVLALIGWVITTIVWSQQQAALIELNREGLTRLKAELTAFELRSLAADENHTKRHDTMDQRGTRALDVVSANQQRVIATLEVMVKRLEGNESRFNEHITANLRTDATQDTAITANRDVMRRVEEQISRIIQALDQTYNLINEHIRVDHREGSRTVNPPLRLPQAPPP